MVRLGPAGGGAVLKSQETDEVAGELAVEGDLVAEQKLG